jgi:hypothetical protein
LTWFYYYRRYYSTGPYVVTWNFRRVKAGYLDDYQIKKYPQKIIADNFVFGQDKNIIVTLPNEVTIVSKKNLQEKPILKMRD